MKNNYFNLLQKAGKKTSQSLFCRTLILFSIIFFCAANLLAQVPALNYSSIQTYTQGTAIPTLSPTNSGGAVAAPGYSANTVVGATNLSNPQSLAVDAAGNIYVSDIGTNSVYKIQQGTINPVAIGTGFNQPYGVAVDATGNVFVADFASNDIKEILASNGTTITVAPVASPTGVVVDAAGNLFVSSYNAGTVLKIYTGGSVAVTYAKGIDSPYGLTVDANDNVYVTSFGTSAVYKIPAGGGTPVALGGITFPNPEGVAVDAAGNVFIADKNLNDIYEVPAGTNTAVGLPEAIPAATDVTVDAAGVLYVICSSLRVVYKVTPVGGYHVSTLPPGLNFDGTSGSITGTPTMVSAAKNYSVTAYNTGGASMPFAINITVSGAPVSVSYTSPKTFTQGTAIAAQTPTSSGVAAYALSGTAVTLGVGFNNAKNVAVDPTGNIYITETGSNDVKKIPAGGGAAVAVGTGFNQPYGIITDAASNVFIADYANGAIKEILASNGTTVTVASGISPAGVTVDAAGDIYIADYGSGSVKEVYAGGSAPVTLANGFSQPYSVAVDLSGNVYVACYGSGNISRIPAGAGAPVIFASGFANPVSLAIDASGNLFLADFSNNAVKEFLAGTNTPISLCSGFVQPSGVGVDPDGNVFVVHGGTDVAEIKLSGGYAVDPALPVGLTLNATTGVISGKPTATNAAANYVINAYNQFGGFSPFIENIKVNAAALTLTYTGPQTYTQGTAITALSPSISGGTIGVPAYSAQATTVALSAGATYGAAADAAGNVFVADFANNVVKKFPAGGGAPVNVGTGFNGPYGLATDPTGNVFVADYNNGAVKEIRASDGATLTIATGVNVSDIALDAAGNIFVADYGRGSLDEIFAGGSAVVTLATGFSQAYAVAVDAAGNVYITDSGHSAIKKYPAGGGALVTVGSGFSAPQGVAVDAVGDIFVADYGNNEVKEIPAGSNTPVALCNGFTSPTSVYVGPAGNLFVTHGTTNVAEIKPADGYYLNQALPMGLKFNSTTGVISGTPTVATPATAYTITGYFKLSGSKAASPSITVNAAPLPTISYATPQNFIRGIQGSAAPTASGVAAPGYSSSAITLASGLSQPIGVAVDFSGNVFESDYNTNSIKEIPAGGGAVTTIATGFSGPYCMATDKNGNIFVADYNNSEVKEVFANGSTPVVVANVSSPVGVAFDTSNNMYVVSYGTGALYEVPAGTTTATQIASGYSQPFGVAVDGLGNAYVAAFNNGAVYKVPPGNTTGGGVSIANGFIKPFGVAVDAAGNVYVTDQGSRSLDEVAAGTSTITTLNTGFDVPNGLAISNSGILYVADGSDNFVREIKPAGGYFLSPYNLPAGLSFNTATGAISGTPATVTTAANYTVTGYNAYGGSTAATLSVGVVSNAYLSSLTIDKGTLKPAFSSTTTGYTASVVNGVSSMTITPTATDPTATIKVNGVVVASGSASQNLPLVVGANTITVKVATQDGSNNDTYTLVITRGQSANDNLSNLKPSAGSLSPAFSASKTAYTEDVVNGAATITITPLTAVPTSTVTVNGTAVTSGEASAPLALNVGANTITTVVTAQDGTTTKTYTITVTRAPSANANLSAFKISKGTLTPAFASATTSYTASVVNGVTSMTVTPTVVDTTATIQVNGTAVASGAASGPIALAVGSNTITTIVTAQDGTTTKMYTLTVTRASGGADSYNPGISVTKPEQTPALANDGIVVHQAISPNGDGINDFLTIDNISQYPDNKLSIMNRNGQLIYEANGYDNSSKVFDGHSNKNGQLQLPGTYFYQLDYTVSGIVKHKTGFLVLKY